MTEKIKTLCGFEDSSHNSLITKIYDIYFHSVIKTIKEEFYNSIITRPIIETGICEIISGQVLNSLARSEPEENISISSFSYRNTLPKGDDLIKSGYEKLAPFLKDYRQDFILSSGEGEGYFDRREK